MMWIMRRWAISILMFFPVQGWADTAPTPSVASFSKANYVREIPASGMSRLLAAEGDNYYFAKSDGSVAVADGTGKIRRVLQAKGKKGAAVLEQPEAVAVAGDTIYVADGETHRVAMFDRDGNFKGSFGSKGGEPGELRSPRGIAVYEGIVYVADTGNRRVQLFGVNGVFLEVLDVESLPANKKAKEAKLPFKLNEPAAIAADSSGKLFVLDADDESIKIYSPDGAFIKSISDGRFLGFCMAPDGFYAADKATLSIRKYDFNGKLAYAFGSRGEGRALFKSITGMVAAKDGQVMIGDSKQNVAHVFSAETGTVPESLPRSASRMSVLWQDAFPARVGKIAWNGKDTLYGIDAGNKAIVRIRNGVAAGEIKLKEINPVSLAVDRNGALWVLDNNKMRVVKLDDAGNLIFSFGGRGTAVGQFEDPTDIAVSSSGIIFVADRGNSWVQAFSSEGVFVNVVRSGVSGKLGNPVAIALDPADKLYVLDKDRPAVVVYSVKGEPMAEFGKSAQEGPASLHKPVDLMATHDEVFVLDENQVKVYSQSGQYARSFGAEGEGAGMLDEPLSITARDSTAFFISERENKRVQTFATLHKLAAPAKLEAQEKVHAIELRWAPSPVPYAAQYRVYRAKNESTGYILLAETHDSRFVDQDLAADEKYHYRVAAVTPFGYEGATSAAVAALSQKYIPPEPGGMLVETTPWQIKISWQAIESPYFKSFLVYQKNGEGYTRLAELDAPRFSRDSLEPNTTYTYAVSSLGTDGIESGKVEVKATTLVFNKPPLDIEIVKLQDIFSGTYKIYEQEGVGRIRLTNNTDKPIDKIKISFMLMNFMDFPTEGKVDALLPGQSSEINLQAVFNSSILSMTEDSSAQAMIEARYLENGVQVVFSKTPTVRIYDKHRMVWGDDERFASFVTPKDPPIIGVVRSVVTLFPEARDELQLAAVLFNGLGVLGLTYIPDPANPYQITSEKVDYVDYVQYPRETLERKSGDCDDLVGLYATALESMGIPTRVIEVPGHMLMMFSTGISADADGYTMDGMYVIHDDKLWVPVETTLVGGPFVKAWESGAATYYKWKDKGLELLDIRKSWNTYKPATLPGVSLKFGEVSASDIEKRSPGDLLSVLKISSQTKTRRYLQAIEKNPADMDAHLQMGIILARLGDRKEAMKYFDKMIATEPKNAAALNNRGNLLMMEEKYPEAQKAYLAAAQASPKDPLILVNLAKSYKAVKDTKKAKAALAKAQKMDPTIKVQYKALALELLNAL